MFLRNPELFAKKVDSIYFKIYRNFLLLSIS